MKKGAYSVVLVAAAGGAFLAGTWHTTGGVPATVQPGSSVHVHGASAPLPRGSALSPATIAVGPEAQQRIGVQVSPVAKTAVTHTWRAVGRVAADETRVYRLNAGIEGSIREVSTVTTGSQVTRDQLLATFSAPGALSVIQLYITNSGGLDRAKQRAAEGSVEGQSVPLATANVRQRSDQLRTFGMSALQMEEISRTREIPDGIKILAPADGVVLARNVSPGLQFERGFEFYRIADLRRVWILADVFDDDAQSPRPGARARVSLPNRRATVVATVADVLPQSDATTGALKVRLEADNAGYLLRPGMFVDVEVAIRNPPTIAVPVDSIVDSGRRRTVFVDRGAGVFEPRPVETGRRFGDRVEVVHGLREGERIVTAGTFLLDSESRLRLPVTGVPASRDAAPAPTGHAHDAHGGVGHGQARHHEPGPDPAAREGVGHAGAVHVHAEHGR